MKLISKQTVEMITGLNVWCCRSAFICPTYIVRQERWVRCSIDQSSVGLFAWCLLSSWWWQNLSIRYL